MALHNALELQQVTIAAKRLDARAFPAKRPFPTMLPPVSTVATELSIPPSRLRNNKHTRSPSRRLITKFVNMSSFSLFSCLSIHLYAEADMENPKTKCHI